MNTTQSNEFENVAVQLSKVGLLITYEEKNDSIIGTIRKKESFNVANLDIDKLKSNIENRLLAFCDGKTLSIKYI